jgi:hypothetical protein
MHWPVLLCGLIDSDGNVVRSSCGENIVINSAAIASVIYVASAVRESNTDAVNVPDVTTICVFNVRHRVCTSQTAALEVAGRNGHWQDR